MSSVSGCDDIRSKEAFFSLDDMNQRANIIAAVRRNRQHKQRRFTQLKCDKECKLCNRAIKTALFLLKLPRGPPEVLVPEVRNLFEILLTAQTQTLLDLRVSEVWLVWIKQSSARTEPGWRGFPAHTSSASPLPASYLLCLLAAEVRRIERLDLHTLLIGRPQPGVFLRRATALLFPGAPVSQSDEGHIRFHQIIRSQIGKWWRQCFECWNRWLHQSAWCCGCKLPQF